MKTAAELRKELRLLRRDMRTAGIRKTSPFNGGMDRDTQRWNERRFALETQLESRIKLEAEMETFRVEVRYRTATTCSAKWVEVKAAGLDEAVVVATDIVRRQRGVVRIDGGSCIAGVSR